MVKKLMVFVWLLVGCASTKITNFSSPTRFLKTDVIMVMPVYGLKEKLSHDLYLIAKKQLKTPENKVFYLPEEEYDILAAGYDSELLHNPRHFDSLTQVLKKTHNIDYVLKVELSGLSPKDGAVGYYSANELNQYNKVYNQGNETAEASLLYYIYRTSAKVLDSQFSVTTSINPMVFGEESGGETRVNLSDEFSALQVAYEKGVKHIKKGMIDNSDL